MSVPIAILILACGLNAVGDSYDANGNTRAATLRPNTTGPATPVNDQYDFENRLVNRNGGQITVVYDGDGQRVRKTVGGVTTHYLVDDLNPTGYAQVVEELTSAGGAPVVTRTYAWGHALLAQDQLLDTGTNFVWQASFYGTDGQGSVRYLTDGAGSITDTYDYDAFGELIQESGNIPNNYLYAGEQFDHDLGLYYLRARYLNPATGRFWTRDPFEGYLDEPFSLHGYLYANADPVNNWDPSGFETLASNQVGQGIRGILQRVVRIGPRFRRSANASCRVINNVSRAQQLYQTAQNLAQRDQAVQQLAALGLAEGGGEISEEQLVALVIQAAFDLRGLDTARLSRFDLQEVIDNLDTPCFTAGTLISTEHGLRPIETLKVGDKVWALGQGIVETALKPITKTFRNEVTNLIILTIGNEVIETTPEHPFWVKDVGWVQASELQAGDQLRTREGKWMPITSTAPNSAPATVFNFEVAEFHTYLVCDSEVLVHNPYPTSPKYPPPTGPGENFQFNFDDSKKHGNSRRAGVRRSKSACNTKSGQIGHHINSVSTHPHLAAETDNVKGTKNRKSHLKAHKGSYNNPTSGPLCKPKKFKCK